MRAATLARLLLANDRASLFRLLGIVCGVAVGVALFLTLWGFAQGIVTRSERASWADYPDRSLYASEMVGDLPDDHIILGEPTLSYSSLSADHFMGHRINVVDVAATPTSTASLPGIGRMPGPGGYLASPAAAALIADNPPDLLGERYGRSEGIIGDAALVSPDSLLIVRGWGVEELRQRPSSLVVSELRGQPFHSSAYQIVAIIGSIAILVPVLLLIGIITRLGAAQRSEMFATLRLIGATPGQTARLAALETSVTSLVGALLGALLAWLTSPLFASIQIDGDRFFAADIQPGPILAVVVALLVTLAATAVAWLRAYRGKRSGLGSSQQMTEAPPRAWRLLPLFCGIAGMSTLAALALSQIGTIGMGLDILSIGGFVAVLLGLILAGPALTWWASRLAARVPHGAAGVLALARIRQHPRTTFRAVGGLVVAVFVVSFFFAAITTATADEHDVNPVSDGSSFAHTLVSGNSEDPSDLAALERTRFSEALVALLYTEDGPAEMEAITERLEALPGVVGAATFYQNTQADTRDESDWAWWLVRTDELAGLGFFTDELWDEPWTEVLASTLPGSFHPPDAPEAEQTLRPVGTVDPDALVASQLIVSFDGDAVVRERVRTALAAMPQLSSMVPQSEAEMDSAYNWTNSFVREYAYLANLGILIATAISGVAMAVSTISGILDRRRTLALMRLMGMPHSTIRRTILMETLLPLFAVFFLSIVLGFLVAQTLLLGITGGSRFVVFSLIDPSYYVVLAICLLFVVGAIIATFPTVRRSTTLAATRF
ncbi:MAG: ABC transporter permease, partial [Coriobacteriales bacterium]|nr:ABC transporter permease [Coriobacteriales bacterium]